MIGSTPGGSWSRLGARSVSATTGVSHHSNGSRRNPEEVENDLEATSPSYRDHWFLTDRVSSKNAPLVVDWLEGASRGRKLRVGLLVASSLSEPPRLPQSRAEVRPRLCFPEQGF